MSRSPNGVAFLDYMVFRNGSIWSFKSRQFLKPVYDRNGYVVATLYSPRKKQYRVSRLVASLHIPNPLKHPQVNHKDGNKKNNHVNNLEWVTAAENNAHAARLGLKAYGEENGNAILDREEVALIRSMYVPRKVTQQMLADRFGVRPQTIYLILAGKTWNHGLS